MISGEENFNQYFRGTGSATDARYGIADAATERGWEDVDPRFSAHNKGFENEANRFGWIVEIDPQNPDSTPVKHTALGRFKHEGANIRIAADGRAVAYSGDDERFDYVYKFISKEKYRAGTASTTCGCSPRATSMLHDSAGIPRQARSTVPARCRPTASSTEREPGCRWCWTAGPRLPGMSVEEVLVYTRLAADKVGATKMDRPEDVEPSPVSGKLYIALTNNTQRGTTGKAAVDEANPRTKNRDGHVIELTERKNDAAATEFSWNILLVAGDPAKDASTYFAGYPKDKVSPIACPDNLAFDSKGNLWISTDGQPGTIGYCDALHKVTLTGKERGKVEQFLAVPAGAETCGPVIHDKDGSVFVSVQHPGEGGSYDKPLSFFPDYVTAPGKAKRGEVYGPRPSVVQVYATGKPGRRKH